MIPALTALTLAIRSAFNVALECFAYDPQDYVARWELESTADDSGYGAHDGTIFSAPTFGTGQIGNALTFDGVDDYISIPDHADLRPTVLTVSAWVKVNENPASTAHIMTSWEATITSDGGGFTLSVTTSGLVSVQVGRQVGSTSFAASTTVVTDDIWHHVTGTVTASELKIYVDGVLETTVDPLFSAVYHAANNVRIGNINTTFGGGGSNFLTGSIDDVRLYDRALSLAEIQAIYASRNVAPPVDFVAEWKMDSNLLDTTGNHNATGVGSPTYATGKEGDKLVLNGTTQYATVVDDAALRPVNITISGWVQGTSFSDNSRIFATGNVVDSGVLDYYGARLSINSSGTAVMLVMGGGNVFGTDYDQTVSTTNTLNSGVWNHICGTYNGSTISIFINGVLESTKAYAAGLVYHANNYVTVGSQYTDYPGSYSKFFSGSIDKLQVFNRAITQSEVTAMYATTPVAYCVTYRDTVVATGPNWYWKLDETSGTVAVDTMGNDNLIYVDAANTTVPSLLFDGTGGAFDSTGGQDVYASGSPISLTTSDFTIEFIFDGGLPADGSYGYHKLLDQWSQSSVDNEWVLEFTSGAIDEMDLLLTIRESTGTLRDVTINTVDLSALLEDGLGNPHYISVRFDYTGTGNVTLEVDGVNKGTVAISGWSGTWRTGTNSGNFRISDDNFGTTNSYSYLDEIAIYLKAITDEERLKLYNMYKFGTEVAP